MSTTPGNPGNLLEFIWSSWKLLYKTVDDRPHWFPVIKVGTYRLFKKLVALFCLCHSRNGPMLCISYSSSHVVDSVQAEAMQTRPGFFLKSLPEISWKFVELNL